MTHWEFLASIPGPYPRPKSLEGICVGMLDNTKPNFDIFLDTVEALLLKNYKIGSIVRHKKPGRTVPVSAFVVPLCMMIYGGIL